MTLSKAADLAVFFCGARRASIPATRVWRTAPLDEKRRKGSIERRLDAKANSFVKHAFVVSANHFSLHSQRECRMRGFTNILTALGVGLTFLFGCVERSSAAESPVTAIDIVLEPDAAMIQRAEAANARLLKVYPKGFALDETRRPHITILQRYVRTSDLKKVYAAVGRVLAKEKAAGWKLKAYKYYYLPWQDNGVAGIVIEPTANLIKLQNILIHVVGRYTVKNGTAAAFAAPPEDPEINQPTMDYVAAFVPKGTGRNFNPHVTVGIASQDYLKQMLAEPFDAFEFSPAGASVYQLGNFGTARKQLKAWELTP